MIVPIARYLTLSVCAVALASLGFAAEKSGALPSDRGRIKVVKNQHGFTLHTDQGSILRGGATWLFKWGREGGTTKYNLDPGYYQLLREHGLNAVRVIMFDPWQRSNKYMTTDLEDARDTAALLEDLDKIVDLASQHELYAVINYHDVGKYDKAHVSRFWEIIAPRYKDRTHVVYELLNEPVPWFPEHYEEKHLTDFAELHDTVRKAAPETHLILLSFANIAGFDPNKTAVGVVRALDKAGTIDWTKASVGYHPYVTGGTSDAIVKVMAEFPVVSTEGHFPKELKDVPDQQRSQSMDGELYQIQTHERLGIGWFQWQIEGPEKFRSNYLGRIVADAKEKGYYWKPE